MLKFTSKGHSRAAHVFRALGALGLALSLLGDGKAAEIDLSAYRGRVVYLDFLLVVRTVPAVVSVA